MTLSTEARSAGAGEAPNALGRALGLLGDEWTLLILREALLGVTRYGDFRVALGISDAVLTNRLQRLAEQGLLERRVYSEAPLRAEYVPTATGRATWPILLGIWEWERRWVPHRAATLPAMRHRACGAAFAPRVACAHCAEPVALAALTAEWGPAGGWQRSIPHSATRRRSEPARANQAGHFPETMTILGNRWSSTIVAAAFLGTTRFSDFQARLGIPAALLAQRLEAFCDVGVFAPAPHPQRATWREYHLTEKGLAFLPVVLALVQWAQQWTGGDPAIEITHRGCGRPLVVELHCDHCGRPLEQTTIDVVPASGA